MHIYLVASPSVQTNLDCDYNELQNFNLTPVDPNELSYTLAAKPARCILDCNEFANSSDCASLSPDLNCALLNNYYNP